MFEVYTTEQVFEDGNANIACNLLHQALIDEFGASTIEAEFFLTGMTARIVQGDAPQPVKVISFGTTQDAIFGFAQSALAPQIGASGAVSFTDQVQLVYNDSIFIEVWLLLAPGTLVNINDIIMQNKANIPAYIE